MPRSRLARLAPLAFVAGLVLLALALVVATLAATGAQPQRIEYHEEGEVGWRSYVAYPVPLQLRGDLRLQVAFRAPMAVDAFTTDCVGMDALREGREVPSPAMRTQGPRGGFSTSLPTLDRGCPFLYVVLAWDARAPDARPPDADVIVSSVLVDPATGAVVVGCGLAGALLAALGGVAWGRRLNRRSAPRAATEPEGTAEALLRAIERGGGWLERTRRHLVAAGVLGVFLWYPVILPWAWRTALEGSRELWLPWALAGGAAALLLAVTALWAREYLRIDRELVEWRERVARLREREAELLADPSG